MRKRLACNARMLEGGMKIELKLNRIQMKRLEFYIVSIVCECDG